MGGERKNGKMSLDHLDESMAECRIVAKDFDSCRTQVAKVDEIRKVATLAVVEGTWKVVLAHTSLVSKDKKGCICKPQVFGEISDFTHRPCAPKGRGSE